jgi:hypothetical protein
MTRGRLVLLGAAALALLAVAPDTVQAQCAMCRTALDSPEGQQMARAFSHGVLLLLAVPLGAVSTVSYLLFRRIRRHRLTTN